MNQGSQLKDSPTLVTSEKRVVKVRRVKKRQAPEQTDSLTSEGLTAASNPKTKKSFENATKSTVSSKPELNSSNIAENMQVPSRNGETKYHQNRTASQFFRRCASTLFKHSVDRDNMNDDAEDDIDDLEESDIDEDQDENDEMETEKTQDGTTRTNDEKHQLQHKAKEVEDLESALRKASNALNGQNSRQPATRNTDNTTGKDSANTSNTKCERPVRVQVERLPSNTGSEKKQKAMSSRSKRSNISLGAILVKGINILLPLFFIVLIALHIAKIGRPVDDFFPQAVMQVNKIGITLWPIMFAAIATQSLRTYATFKAERGIKLMTLEQLLHSSSFSSALKQPLLLRKITLASILLFFLWALSPLASQALQNLAFVRSTEVITAQDISYLITDGSLWNWVNGGADDQHKISRDSLFSTALLSNRLVKSAPQDLWNNPRIPDVNSLGDPDADGWHIVPGDNNNASGTSYTSLMGIILANISQTQVTNFTVDSSFISLDCGALKNVTKNDFDFTQFEASPSLTLWLRIQSHDLSNTTGTMEWASLVNDTDVMNGLNKSGIGDDTQFTYSSCSFQSTVVTSQISCGQNYLRGPCSVRAIRQKSTDTVNPATWGPFATQPFLQAVPGNIGAPTLQELYLMNPASILGSETVRVSSIGDLTEEVFTERLQTLVNTLDMVSGAGNAYTEDFSYDAASVGTVSGEYIDSYDVWDISPYWVAIFLFCNIAILLLALADIVCEAKTVSPDFLGFASSVVRNNQHLRKEMRGRMLSGHEKARAMSSLSVMLQDVNGDHEKGKIILAPRTAASVRLRKERDYQ